MADLNLWSAKGHWHLFNGNSVIVNIHNRDTSDFANPTSEVAITCGDDVATGLTPLKKTIICVGPLVLTRQTLYPRVTQDPELKKRHGENISEEVTSGRKNVDKHTQATNLQRIKIKDE